MKSLKMLKDMLNEMFVYKDGKIYWKDNTQAEASYVNNVGYHVVDINGNPYRRSRIVVCMLKGEFPTKIDTITDDRTKDRIEDLEWS